MRILISNIKKLCQVEASGNDRTRVKGGDMAALPCIDDAWLVAENGRIHSFGTMDNLPSGQFDETVSAYGGMVLPAWCDSHTHLVFQARGMGSL